MYAKIQHKFTFSTTKFQLNLAYEKHYHRSARCSWESHLQSSLPQAQRAPPITFTSQSFPYPFFIIQSENRCPGLSKYNLPNRFLHSQTPGQILPHSGNIHSQTNLRKIYKLYHTTHTFGVTYCYLELRTGTSLSTRSHYNCKPKISLLEGSKVPKGNVTTNVLKITNI